MICQMYFPTVTQCSLLQLELQYMIDFKSPEKKLELYPAAVWLSRLGQRSILVNTRCSLTLQCIALHCNALHCFAVADNYFRRVGQWEASLAEVAAARKSIATVLGTLEHASTLNTLPGRTETHASRLGVLLDGLRTRLPESEFVALRAQLENITSCIYHNAAVSLNSPAILDPTTF